MKPGFLLAKIVNPIAMGVDFFVALTPLTMFLRARAGICLV
jgi:hypothetical protein